MWLGPIIPALAAVVAGFLVWRHETRRLDRRTYYEPRGWDTTEQDFRRQVLGHRRRRRIGLTVLSALAGSVVATAALQLAQFSQTIGGG
jgi:hypothetical protein